jgi:hypothetical protein
MHEHPLATAQAGQYKIPAEGIETVVIGTLKIPTIGV